MADKLQVKAYISSPKLIRPFSRIFRSEFLIKDLISRLIATENGISIYQDLSLVVDSKKQIKLKISRLFNCSFKTFLITRYNNYYSASVMFYHVNFLSLQKNLKNLKNIAALYLVLSTPTHQAYHLDNFLRIQLQIKWQRILI